MLNSETLEVAIGMAFLFLLMSLICTAVQEFLEGIFRWRASDLERAVRTLLDDGDGTLTAFLYRHPFVFSLFKGRYRQERLTNSDLQPPTSSQHMSWWARRNLPSYIPAVSFATAFLDLVARGPVSGAAGDEQGAINEPLSVTLLRERAATLSSPHLRRVLLSAIDYCGGDLEKLRLNIQDWFDGTMDRTSGWYKRRTQTVLFLLGITLAVVLNVDALHIMERLTADKAFREVVVNEAAVAAAPAMAASGTPGERIELARKKLYEVSMPVGWRGIGFGFVPQQFCSTQMEPCAIPENSGYLWVRTVFGWFVTAFAMMLGAPFWFDLLNKFMVIRSTVKPKEKSPEEGSEDRQVKGKVMHPTATVMPASTAAQPAPAPQALNAALITTPALATEEPVPPSDSHITPFEPHQWQSSYVNPNKEIQI